MNTTTMRQGDIDECLARLQNHKVKLVAFDMDFTAVAAHSRGNLLRSKLDEYISKVSPAFLALVPRLYESGFYLGIATHSDEAQFDDTVRRDTHILGEELVRALLEKCFVPAIHEAFFIVAYNPRVHPGGVDPDSNKIKRYHMRKLQEKFKVKASEILFFDDTQAVISDCIVHCGVSKSFKVDPLHGFQLSDLLLNLE